MADSFEFEIKDLDENVLVGRLPGILSELPLKAFSPNQSLPKRGLSPYTFARNYMDELARLTQLRVLKPPAHLNRSHFKSKAKLTQRIPRKSQENDELFDNTSECTFNPKINRKSRELATKSATERIQRHRDSENTIKTDTTIYKTKLSNPKEPQRTQPSPLERDVLRKVKDFKENYSLWKYLSKQKALDFLIELGFVSKTSQATMDSFEDLWRTASTRCLTISLSSIKHYIFQTTLSKDTSSMLQHYARSTQNPPCAPTEDHKENYHRKSLSMPELAHKAKNRAFRKYKHDNNADTQESKPTIIKTARNLSSGNLEPAVTPGLRPHTKKPPLAQDQNRAAPLRQVLKAAEHFSKQHKLSPVLTKELLFLLSSNMSAQGFS